MKTINKVFLTLGVAICWIALLFMIPMGYWQADDRVILELFVTFWILIIIPVMWEITKEAYNELNK